MSGWRMEGGRVRRTGHFVEEAQDGGCGEEGLVEEGGLVVQGGDEDLETFALVLVRGERGVVGRQA